MAIGRKNGGCQRPKDDGRDDHQHERDERQQQPVHAAEAQADDLRLRGGLDAPAPIEDPADREAAGDDGELDPAGARRERSLDAGENRVGGIIRKVYRISLAPEIGAAAIVARHAVRASTSA